MILYFNGEFIGNGHFFNLTFIFVFYYYYLREFSIIALHYTIFFVLFISLIISTLIKINK